MNKNSKPHLSQLKKRPSLWICNEDIARIVYPNGVIEFYSLLNTSENWETSILQASELVLNKDDEFLGWI